MGQSKRKIASEVKKLKELRDKVIPYSMFGDDHCAGIDAQIKVLELDIPEDEIYERSCSHGEKPNGTKDWTNYQRMCALEAYDWKNFDDDDAPSEDWKDILIPNTGIPSCQRHTTKEGK